MMSGAAHVDPSNRKVALLISVLATLLAFSETLGKSTQTEALSRNIEAANLWSFFQAKTIRMTTVRTALEQAEVQLPSASGDVKQALAKRIEDWRKTAARYDTEPIPGKVARSWRSAPRQPRPSVTSHSLPITSMRSLRRPCRLRSSSLPPR
jgi:hypothetical protein